MAPNTGAHYHFARAQTDNWRHYHFAGAGKVIVLECPAEGW
jgi:hypothetical protein